jgi:hypothetical protein
MTKVVARVATYIDLLGMSVIVSLLIPSVRRALGSAPGA